MAERGVKLSRVSYAEESKDPGRLGDEFFARRDVRSGLAIDEKLDILAPLHGGQVMPAAVINRLPGFRGGEVKAAISMHDGLACRQNQRQRSIVLFLSLRDEISVSCPSQYPEFQRERAPNI